MHVRTFYRRIKKKTFGNKYKNCLRYCNLKIWLVRMLNDRLNNLFFHLCDNKTLELIKKSIYQTFTQENFFKANLEH